MCLEGERDGGRGLGSSINSSERSGALNGLGLDCWASIVTLYIAAKNNRTAIIKKNVITKPWDGNLLFNFLTKRDRKNQKSGTQPLISINKPNHSCRQYSSTIQTVLACI